MSPFVDRTNLFGMPTSRICLEIQVFTLWRNALRDCELPPANMATHGRKLIALLVLLLLQCLIAASLQSEAQVEQIIQESDDRFSDKLVQESYDAGTEAQLKVERDAAEGSIDNREDKEIALLKDIDVLLDGLASHVQEEKDSATDQAKIERAANGENKKLENVRAQPPRAACLTLLSACRPHLPSSRKTRWTSCMRPSRPPHSPTPKPDPLT